MPQKPHHDEGHFAGGHFCNNGYLMPPNKKITHQDEVDLAKGTFCNSVNAPLAKDVAVLTNEDLIRQRLKCEIYVIVPLNIKAFH